MNKGFLIIYNTCTISQQFGEWVERKKTRDGGVQEITHNPYTVDYFGKWLRDINSFYNQKFKDYKLIISECRGNKDAWSKNQKRIKEIDDFVTKIKNNGNHTDYNIINEDLPVHATFNFSVMKAVEKYGEFEYYMYVSSGINFSRHVTRKLNPHIFGNVYNFLKENKNIARLQLAATNDNCFPPDNTIDSAKSLETEPYYIKPGYRINDHCSIYSNEYYKAYNGRIRPDIYIGNGTEPTFSYLTAAINKSNAIAPLNVCPKLEHRKRSDGINPGIGNTKWFLNYKSKDDIKNFKNEMHKNDVYLDYGKGLGISRFKGGGGFTNEPNVKPYLEKIEKKFGKNGSLTNDEERKKFFEFIKSKLFASNDIVDYNNIKHSFIK